MERLNEIFDRNGRQQPLSEQRARTRTPQSQDPVSRRAAVNNAARLRAKYQSNTPPQAYQQNTSLSSRTRNYPPYRPNENTDTNNVERHSTYAEPISRVDQSTYTPAPTQPRRTLGETNSPYQSLSQPHQDQPHIQPLQPHPTSHNEYYPQHTPDAYPSDLRADAIEEWEQEGMGYGDWEKEGDNYYFEDESAETFEVATTPSAPKERIDEQSTQIDIETSERGTRNLHDTRLASAIATQQAGTQRYATYQQRITQPLSPQTVAELARERSPLAPTSPTRLSRPMRQDITPALHPIEEPVTTLEEPITDEIVPIKDICHICKGAGFLRSNVPFGHPNFGKPIACKCKETERKEKRRQQLRDMSNMDAFRSQIFRTFTLNMAGVQEAYNEAMDFSKDPHGWLVLVGPNGCGKTHLAAAIANTSLDSGAVVLFEAVPDLLDHLRAAFAPTANEVYDQLFSKMREAELLVLDDLGSQQSSSWANEKLFQLLNYRYNMSMPTVITANPKGLHGIDERIRSRLNDNSLVTTVNMERARDFRPHNVKRR
jgi:DNA replication protein DnaC